MHSAAYFRERASQFRDMAKGADERTAADLIILAEEYEVEAQRLELDAEPPMPSAS